jgi:hypothetical protein
LRRKADELEGAVRQ